jgi:hypothetical protein
MIQRLKFTLGLTFLVLGCGLQTTEAMEIRVREDSEELKETPAFLYEELEKANSLFSEGKTLLAHPIYEDLLKKENPEYPYKIEASYMLGRCFLSYIDWSKKNKALENQENTQKGLKFIVQAAEKMFPKALHFMSQVYRKGLILEDEAKQEQFIRLYKKN